MGRAWLRWLPLPILLLGALAAGLLARGRPAAPEPVRTPPPPRVEVLEARPRDVLVVLRTHGSVEPAREIELVAELAGRVALVSPALEPGASFAAGELLVALDRADAELALERAEAALIRRDSEHRLAGARLARLRSLRASEVASAAQIEEAEHAERSARAGLREARAAREQARRDLARTEMRAPFAGRARTKQVDVGQFVARGSRLAGLYATDAAEVRLPVALAEFADLGLPLAGEVDAGPRVTLRARLGSLEVAWLARVVRVEGEIAQRSRMVHVVARVETFGGEGLQALAPGLFVEAEIEGRTLEQAFVLPRAALRGRDEVMTLDGDGLLRARRVEVLRVEGERVLVREGLSPGDRVCASSLGLMEGSKVRAVPSAAGGMAVSALACAAGFCPARFGPAR